MYKHRFAHKFPLGSIRDVAEIHMLLADKDFEKIEIPLYSVEQMGHISIYVIHSGTVFTPNKNDDSSMSCKGPGFDKINVRKDYSNNESYSYDLLMGTYCIGDDYGQEHRLFTNRKLAERYSNELKNDADYIRSVHAHWNWCNETFRDTDYFDED